MALFNKYKLIVVLLITATAIGILSCKKQEDHTSFYFESSNIVPVANDESQIQQAAQLETYKFTNNTPPWDVIGINGVVDELLWLRATKTFDFTPIGGAPAVDDNNRTQARLMYDNEALYIMIRCWDNSTTFSLLAPGQDFRGSTDVVTVFIEPDGDNQDIYSIQVTPDGKSTLAVYPTPSVNSFTTLPGGDGGVYAQGRIDYNSYNNGREGFKGWCAEIKIPFNAAHYNMSTPGGGTQWKVNIIRQDFDSVGTGNAPAFRGKYGWKDPAALFDNNPTFYSTIRYNTNDISATPFQVYMKGFVLSGGAVHLSDHGFTGYTSSPPLFSTVTPLNISLGNKINPGEASCPQSVRVGDSLVYRFYVTRPDGSTSKSFYERKHLIR